MSGLIAAKSAYDAMTKTQTFKNLQNNNLDDAFNVSPIMGIFNTIIMVIALYMSFKCNKGFNLGSVLMACCCSIFYIPYRLAVPC